MNVKRVILAVVVAIVMAMPITTSGAGHKVSVFSAKAGEAEASAAKIKVMAGSWTANITAPGFPPFKVLMSFTEDGCLIVSQAILVPFATPSGRAVFSAAHGEWDKVSNGEFSYTFVALIHDEYAQFIGTAKVSGTLQVNESMDTFNGVANATDYDADGNVIFTFSASIQGRRIRVES